MLKITLTNPNTQATETYDVVKEFNPMFERAKELGLISSIFGLKVKDMKDENAPTLRMLKEFGVSVYFEEQGIDTQQMNMEMIVTFPGMAAQQESETISGNVRWGIKKRMESGEYIISRPAFGYTLMDGKIIINEAEAEVVRRIFNLYLKGMGINQISDLLNEENVPKPRHKENEKWKATTVRYILRNEKYMGDAILHKRYTTEALPFRRKRNHGELPMYYVEDYNPPIVSQEIFQAVQTLMDAKRSQRSESKESLLNKKMRCPECGRTFRKQTVGGKVYWLCSLHATQGKCSSRRVREEMVLDTFTAMIYKLKANREVLLEKLIQRLEYREVFHPVSSEAREELNKKVLAAYEQKLTEEQSQEQDETETLSEDESQAPVTQTM